MTIAKHISIIALFAVVYWLANLLFHEISESYHHNFGLITVPLVMGAAICCLFRDMDRKVILLYCVFVVLVRYLINAARVWILFYGDNQIYHYTWGSITAFFYIGPIEIFFLLTGFFLALKMRGIFALFKK